MYKKKDRRVYSAVRREIIDETVKVTPIWYTV